MLRQPLSQLFTGRLHISKNIPLLGLNLSSKLEVPLYLTPVEVGRLCMAPDNSIITVRRLGEQGDGTPAGVNILSSNKFVPRGEHVIVVAYKDAGSIAVRVDSLHLARMMLTTDAPVRLCTVAFGLMACTAYQFGFNKITLFAAGNGPRKGMSAPDDYVGYLVWPKLGFNAPLVPADLNEESGLAHCKSVQDVLQTMPHWWATHGRGREMEFDLAPDSRSWNVLLHYLDRTFAEGDL